MCCVILFVLLLCWWSCSRRQADAKSFLPAFVVRSGLARVGVTSTTSGPSRLDCTGANRGAGGVCLQLLSGTPRHLFRYRGLCPSGWMLSLLSLACYAPHGSPFNQGVWAFRVMCQLLCTSSCTRNRHSHMRRALSRHRGNRPTPTPWQGTHPKRPQHQQ